MFRTIRRLAPLASSAAPLLALWAASSAHAATSVQTLSATPQTPASADLYGLIDPGGQSTTWEFQYGPGTSYVSSTPAQTIPPGQPEEYVIAYVTQLHPNTLYHFRVAAFVGIGSDSFEDEYGADRTFRTSPSGKLRLLQGKLIASRGFLTAPLACQSSAACQGAFSIKARRRSGTHHTLVNVRCAAASFQIPAGKSRKVRARVRRGCSRLLRAAPHHTLSTSFSATLATGQVGPNRKIKLRLG
jgi:hypothetical protein